MSSESGRICTAGCCNGLCSGPLYRIVPLVAISVAVLLSIFLAVSGEGESYDDAIWHIVEWAFVIFFTTDFVIQSCIIKGSQPDCCGDCGCGCGVTLLVKLIIDGIYLFVSWVGMAMAFLIDADGDLSLWRIFGLLIFVKLAMEIAAIAILCTQTPSKQEMIGQPVQVPPLAVIGQPVSTEPNKMEEVTDP